MSLFPILQPQAAAVEELPLCREAAWNFTTGAPVFRGGEPVVVTGKSAVVVWAWKALKTVRFRHEIYTWGYGCEVERLIGQPYTQELKQAEASRYVRECLLVSPYITAVNNIQVSFTDSTLTVEAVLETIYGEEALALVL